MDDNYLQLSGVQHYMLCPRQWGIIHIEQQWEENYLTYDGMLKHQRVHDSSIDELRNGVLTIRGIPIRSNELKVYGICDAVEFHQKDNGITLHNSDGHWDVVPIEHKHGKPKTEQAFQHHGF